MVLSAAVAVAVAVVVGATYFSAVVAGRSIRLDGRRAIWARLVVVRLSISGLLLTAPSVAIPTN